VRSAVVDASVAVKWCMPAPEEELVPEAVELLASYRSGETRFLVPDLFWVEVANALWKAVRREKISKEFAQAALTSVTDLPIPTISSFDLMPQTLRLAIDNGRTVYDSLYLALAVQAKTELITADERLANALAARFPVKWLGAL
jgi:predicted nucleic acid-binding protein